MIRGWFLRNCCAFSIELDATRYDDINLRPFGGLQVKITITVILSLSLCSFAATKVSWAAQDRCEMTATRAVEGQFRHYFFDSGKRIRSVEVVDCERKLSRRGMYYQSCEVGASTGDGAGDVTFGVMQSDDCRRAFSAFIIGEE